LGGNHQLHWIGGLMWDNSNIIIWQKDGSALYLYAQYGEQLPQILQQALKKSEPSWNNDAVMNRIIFNEMLASSPDGNNEFSLSTSANTQSNPSHNIHVDIAKQMIFIGSHDRKHWGETWHEGEHLNHEPDHWNFLTFVALNIPLTFPIHHQTHHSSIHVEPSSEIDNSFLDNTILIKDNNNPSLHHLNSTENLQLIPCDSLIEHLVDDSIYTFLWNNQPVHHFVIQKHLLNEAIQGNDMISDTAMIEFDIAHTDSETLEHIIINLPELCDSLMTSQGEWKINQPHGMLKIIPELS
jgi:hypothetical protein